MLRIALTALVLVVAALGFSACGGEEAADAVGTATDGASTAIDTANSTADALNQANAQASDSGTTVGNDPGAAVDTSSPGIAEVAPGSQVQTSEETPKAFVKALGKRPILVVLYQPGAIVDDYLLEEAAAASKRVKDVLFLSYTPAQYKAMGDLPEQLGLFRAPGVAIVNRAGSIENFWTTYVDQGLLGSVLVRAGNTPASNVTSDVTDAPPPNGFDSAADSAADDAVS